MIECYKKLYEDSRSLLPLLFGAHRIPLNKLMDHKENARLHSPSIQRFIIEGKVTVDEVIFLSDEDMLIIETREKSISDKISSDKGITLAEAIKLSLKEPICYEVNQGKAILAVGPAIIRSEGFSNCVAILIKGQLTTGQDAHVFCHVDMIGGVINGEIVYDFSTALSKINHSTCKAALIHNSYSPWARRALSFLNAQEIPTISQYTIDNEEGQRTGFDISYTTDSGEIRVKSGGEAWKKLASFDMPQSQENPTLLDVMRSPSEKFKPSSEAHTLGQFFLSADKKTKPDDSAVVEANARSHSNCSFGALS